MQPPKKHIATGVGLGIVGVLLVALAMALVVAYSGAYNIAATQDHSPFVRWMFTTTMENSIRHRAADIEPPAAPTDAMIAAGAVIYKSTCQHCHGGPGVRQAEWATGMLPEPPHLPDVAAEWAPNEVFWIVKHGIKMTGMPAFGPTHDDQTLWSVAAFVKQLPGMTAEQYARYQGGHSGGHSDGHTGGHGH